MLSKENICQHHQHMKYKNITSIQCSPFPYLRWLCRQASFPTRSPIPKHNRSATSTRNTWTCIVMKRIYQETQNKIKLKNSWFILQSSWITKRISQKWFAAVFFSLIIYFSLTFKYIVNSYFRGVFCVTRCGDSKPRTDPHFIIFLQKSRTPTFTHSLYIMS